MRCGRAFLRRPSGATHGPKAGEPARALRVEGGSPKGRHLGSGSAPRRQPVTAALEAEGTASGDTEFLLLRIPAGNHRNPKQFQEFGFRPAKTGGRSGSRHGDLLRTNGVREIGPLHLTDQPCSIPSSERTKRRTNLARATERHVPTGRHRGRRPGQLWRVGSAALGSLRADTGECLHLPVFGWWSAVLEGAPPCLVLLPPCAVSPPLS